MQKHNIFVYGTLRGDCGGRLIQGKYVGADVISGNLYDLGWYPGVRDVPPEYVGSFWESSGNVTGEVWEVDDDELLGLDAYEGTDSQDPYNPQRGLYHRVKTKTFAGRDVEVYVYSGEIPNENIIPGGDWKHYNDLKGKAA